VNASTLPSRRSALRSLSAAVPAMQNLERSGMVTKVVGLTAEIEGLKSYIGELVTIEARAPRQSVLCQVVGFQAGRTIVMPFRDPLGIAAGSRAVALGSSKRAIIGNSLLGRIVDGLGVPMDGGPPLRGMHVPIEQEDRAAHPLRRLPITEPLVTGIRVLDGLLTCGRGQRLGIFAGSGVGKSTFLGMIARNSDSDINVVALIGERAREVQEFIAHNLGEEGLRRSVLVVATSDQPALVRLNAAWVAAAIAEYFRDAGRHVLFMMDSVTRFAMAQREIGLAVGEPPATRGYTPSVFAQLPRLLERTGTGERGTITGFYTVLVEGDDLNEPITDTVRGTLDGHIVLSRDLATAHHYPAVDVLASVSRLMPQLATPAHASWAARCRQLLAAHRSAKDLLEIGAYVPGTNLDVDAAVARLPHITAYLRQQVHEVTPWAESLAGLEALAQ